MLNRNGDGNMIVNGYSVVSSSGVDLLVFSYVKCSWCNMLWLSSVLVVGVVSVVFSSVLNVLVLRLRFDVICVGK